MKVVTVAMALLGAACGAPCQMPNSTRCNGSVLELCGSNSKWQRAMDCSKVRPARDAVPVRWSCGETDAGCRCVSGK
jgi:hypothetical protein